MKAEVLNDAPERTIALILLRRVCDPRSGIALIRVDA